LGAEKAEGGVGRLEEERQFEFPAGPRRSESSGETTFCSTYVKGRLGDLFQAREVCGGEVGSWSEGENVSQAKRVVAREMFPLGSKKETISRDRQTSRTEIKITHQRGASPPCNCPSLWGTGDPRRK